MSQLFNSSLFVVVAIVGVILLGIGAVLCTWRRVPSDKAAVIVGTSKKPKVVTGGGTLVIPVLQRIDTITLENIMFTVEIKQTKTSLGVPINAEGIVVLKVKNDEESILAAMQQFKCDNDKQTVDTIKAQSSEVCKGKLREIVSSMSVEDIYNDRESFASKVQSVAGTELGEMGLELKSFTINDITDDDGYIEALGKEQIAKVKAQAAIAEAEAKRDQAIKTAEANKETKIRTAEANKEGREAELKSEADIKKAEKDKELKVLEYEKEQNTQKAISDSAYTIQENITAKEITNTDMDNQLLKEQRNKEIEEAKVQVEIAKEQKNIELAKKKAERKEAELIETVVNPAEAEKTKRIKEAEAKKEEQIKEAEAKAEQVRLDGQARAEAIREVGQAEAEAIRAKGLAENEALEKKAEALSKMDEAGKLQMIIEKLPEIAKAVAEPMSKIGNITIIGGGSDGNTGVGDVTRYTVQGLSAVSEALKETLGFDIKDLMQANTIQAKTDRNITITADGAKKIKEAIDKTIDQKSETVDMKDKPTPKKTGSLEDIVQKEQEKSVWEKEGAKRKENKK